MNNTMNTQLKNIVFQLTEDIKDLSGDTDMFYPHGTAVTIIQGVKTNYPIVEPVFNSKYSFPVKWDQIRLVNNPDINP